MWRYVNQNRIVFIYMRISTRPFKFNCFCLYVKLNREALRLNDTLKGMGKGMGKDNMMKDGKNWRG